MKTNILFIGSHPPQKLIKEKNIDSLYRCSETIISGIKAREDINLSVITSPDIVSFPKQDFYFPSFIDEDSTLMVSSLNLPVIKQFWTIVSMIIASRKIIKRCDGNTIVMIPYMVFRHVAVSRLLKLLFPKKVEVCIIIPDIFFPNNFFHKTLNKWTEKLAVKSDYFILYTQAMREYLHISNRPNVVIEGYCKIPTYSCPEKESSSKIITYAGSLNVKYGICRLLEAFTKLENSDVVLNLYGTGDAEELIQEYAKIDSRVRFLGRIPKERVMEVLYKSDILINPRGAHDGEYVEYSFPSKDIEYLGTGRACIFCKLPGMPVEYYPFFIDAGDGSVEQLYESILKCLNMTSEERNKLGRSAHTFISQRMDIRYQIKQILSLFK